MQPVSWDDKIYRGDGFRLGFRPFHVEPDGTKVYDYNFTGWTGKAQLRRSANSEIVLIEFTVLVDVGDPDIVWVTATGDQTQDLDEESGVYDVQMTPSAGEPMTIARGRLDVVPDVTRS